MLHHSGNIGAQCGVDIEILRWTTSLVSPSLGMNNHS